MGSERPAPASAPVAAVPERRIARLGDRLIAIILDSILLIGLFAALGMWVAARVGGLTDTGFSLEGAPSLPAIGATLLGALLYCLLLEAFFGVTLGKAIIGTSVQRAGGRRCGLRGSLIRNLLRIIDGLAVYVLGFLVALFSKSRQRLGDRAAGTIVGEQPPGAPARAGVVVLWLGLTAAGFVAAWMLHRAAPGPGSLTLATGGFRVANFQFLESKGGPPRAVAPYKPGGKVFTRRVQRVLAAVEQSVASSRWQAMAA